jgi:phosphotransferase system HPr-like phosphotransfer protein
MRQPQRGRKEVHMKEVLIKLNEINDVYTLVNTLVGYDGDVDLVSGRYMVDGKSLLGIFSLDLRQPVKMIIHDEDKVDELLEKLADMIVE